MIRSIGLRMICDVVHANDDERPGDATEDEDRGDFVFCEDVHRIFRGRWRLL